VAELVSYLGVSRSTVFSMLREGQRSKGRVGLWPAHYFGARTLRVRRSDVDRCAARYRADKVLG
jgi:predicted DNA-binding transcriptional regulator AlpA